MKEALSGVSVIVVDEASMMGCLLANTLEERLRTVAPRLLDKPWGGYRMVFVGDFCQCPPVRSGRPLHTHVLFRDFEVAVLTTSHRVTETESIELADKMRRRVLVGGPAGDGERLRRKCCPQYNLQRAEEYNNDFMVFHLVTTNREVDEINDKYIKDYARVRGKKVATGVPEKGKSLAFADGVRFAVITNIRKDYGITNGLFCTSTGALYADNASVEIPDRPVCMLVIPDRVDDRQIDTCWSHEVDVILRNGTSSIRGADGNFRALIDGEIRYIVQQLHGIIPIAEVPKCKDDDGTDGGRMKWTSSFPLRLARAVTIHKLQGISLEKLIMTPGSRRMFGTTFTGFTRAKGGFGCVILADNYDDAHLVDDLNADPGADFDMVGISAKLNAMTVASLARFRAGSLYIPPLSAASVGNIPIHAQFLGREQTEQRGRGRGRGTRGVPGRGRGQRGSVLRGNRGGQTRAAATRSGRAR